MANLKFNPMTNVISIKSLKDKAPKRVLLYHALDEATGDYCNEYAVEFLFNSKNHAIGFLKKLKLDFTEVADSEAMPY